MAYSNAIPQANDIKSQSQGDLLANFVAIQTFVEVNHETFAAANEGKHKFVTFPEQGADPTTAANEVAVYSKTSALGDAGTALFLRKEGDGTVIEFTSSTQNANGWTRLPSGILLKWGTGTVNANTTAVATFPVAATVPAFTAVYNVSVTRQGQSGDAGALYYQAFDTTTITVYNASAATGKTFYYLAIGI